MLQLWLNRGPERFPCRQNAIYFFRPGCFHGSSWRQKGEKLPTAIGHFAKIFLFALFTFHRGRSFKLRRNKHKQSCCESRSNRQAFCWWTALSKKPPKHKGLNRFCSYFPSGNNRKADIPYVKRGSLRIGLEVKFILDLFRKRLVVEFWNNQEMTYR